jgi:hypothetical protein
MGLNPNTHMVFAAAGSVSSADDELYAERLNPMQMASHRLPSYPACPALRRVRQLTPTKLEINDLDIVLPLSRITLHSEFSQSQTL